MKIPAFLKPGDQVCMIAPAGKIAPEIVEHAILCLQDWGLKPKVASHIFDNQGRYSSNVSSRLSDFREAIEDPEIKAIFCARGGYGAVHLVEYLSSESIALHPKWLIGYSDVTLLHALFFKSGVLSLHAPMAAHIGAHPLHPSTLALKQILFGEGMRYTFKAHPLNQEGIVRGTLIGGNLSVLTSLRATDIDFEYKDKILFIEDIGEAPYKVERMLYNLRLSGVLPHLKGLIVGHFSEYEEDMSVGGTVYDLIHKMVSPYGYPVCYGIPVGHETDNYPFPEGGTVNLEINSNGVLFDWEY